MPSSLSDWIGVIAAIGMILFGGGGAAAWLKQRHDRKNGIRQENRNDIDSLNARAVAIIETQFNYLIKPLQEKLDTQTAELKRLEADVRQFSNLYQVAVGHIRSLYAWITRHMPADVLDNTEIPKPPDSLMGDLEYHQ